MAYPDTADLVAASTVPELVDLEVAEQDALRASAITAVEAYCRQSFLPDGTTGSPVTHTFDGTGSRLLYLRKGPSLLRLSELTALTVNDGAVATDAVRLDEQRGRLSLKDPGTWGSYYERAMEQVTRGPCEVFDQGSSNIAVSGVWGWTDDDYDADLAGVTEAIQFDMEDQALANAHGLAGSVRAARALGVESINQGGMSVGLRRGEPAISARCQRALSGLVRRSEAGALV